MGTKKKTHMRSELALTRRGLMAAMAGGASWFLPSLVGEGEAQAAPSGAPKRLIVVFSHQGVQRERWKMRQPGLGETSNWEFPLAGVPEASFSEILRPLYRHRNRMTVIDGLPMLTAIGDTRGKNDHYRGWMGSLTGAFISDVGTDLAGGPSFDQVVAAAIQRPGQIKSIELAVQGYIPAIWAARGVGILPELSAGRALSRLFANVSTGAPTTTTDADRVRNAQKAVLQLTSGRFNSISQRLSGEDQRKLELHRDMMLDLAANFDTGQQVACARPTLPTAGSQDYLGWSRQHIALMTAGLACDLTRVFSLQLADCPNYLMGNLQGNLHNEYFHDCNENRVHPNSADVMSLNCQNHAKVIGELLDSLQAVPEAGGTMLDNTLVAWFHELSSGAHAFWTMPHVLFGNVGGHFRTGRYIRYAPQYEVPRRTGPIPVGPPHNRLIVSIMKSFGMTQNHFGEASMTIPGTGQTVDLGGTLDRLT
jgi:Protein of unknown function (DUF1552)